MSTPSTTTPTVLVALSGPTSSGKTTVARHVLRLLQSLVSDDDPATAPLLIHQDDFYHPDTAIPIKDGLQDWDCVEAIDVPKFEAALRDIKTGGRLPADFKSLELPEESSGEPADGVHDVPKQAQGRSGITEELLSALRGRLREAIGAGRVRVCLVEGFLLFPPGLFAVADVFDRKLLLLASYAAAKARREARAGYVTLEGFWTDPPGYVERIVWPNYVGSHAVFFRDGDVEGEVDEGVCREHGVKTYPPGGLRHAEGGSIAEILEWTVDELVQLIRTTSFGRDGGEGDGR